METTKGRYYQWPVEDLRRWVEVEGTTHSAIGVRLGVSGKLVSKACGRFGIKSRRRGPRSGAGHPNWRGGRTVTKDGYVAIYSPGHPNSKKPVPYVLEHRLVLEKSIGRYLTRTEVVHHKNGVRDDNRIENLQLFGSNAEHLAFELKGRRPQWGPEGLESLSKIWSLMSTNPLMLRRYDQERRERTAQS